MTIEFNPLGKISATSVGVRKPLGDGSRTSSRTAAIETPLVRIDAIEAMRVPPVDQDRVAQVRNAIARGDYPILPVKVCDALIAASLALALPDDQA